MVGVCPPQTPGQTKNPLCVLRISGPVLVCSVQRTLVQTCIDTAALRGTRLSEARLIFMVLIMSMQRMGVSRAMITRSKIPPVRYKEPNTIAVGRTR
jgi:hypothetical protein